MEQPNHTVRTDLYELISLSGSILLTILLNLGGVASCRVDEEDDEMYVNDEAIEKLVIVTRVGKLLSMSFIWVNSVSKDHFFL